MLSLCSDTHPPSRCTSPLQTSFSSTTEQVSETAPEPSAFTVLYRPSGEWTLTEPGFTAVGHPSSLEIARTHGVYVPQDMEGTREKYLKGELAAGFECARLLLSYMC